ncbi:integral membrane protein GPR155 [Patella vulgata]|uniref:integral membrane protein GPR155 n=1 Tax=Patella vulgata TaxID=6465 RepID=UPI00217F9467|nr:integral membrane protein GPR155 [Patella vulgata]
MLFINIVIVIVALTIKQRNDQLVGDYAALSLSYEKSDEIGDESEKKGASNKDADIINEEQRRSPNQRSYNSCNTIPKVPSIEDILPFPKSNSTSSITDVTSDESNDEHPLFDTLNERTCLIQKCGPTQRRQCITNLRKYMVASASVNDDPQAEPSSSPNEALLKEYQSSHHFVLVLLLLLSMLVGLFLCVWKLFNTHPTGIYIEIEFLDGVFNYGQGFITFAVFGFDTRLIFSKVVRRIRRWLYGVEMVQLPDMSDLDDETVQICKQFTEYHQENCAKMIVKDLRYRLRMYKDVFTGKALCDWLINVGLAKDRLEAIEYGRHLTMGRTLAHVTGEHFFHDLPYFYRFLSNEPKYSSC